MLAFLVFGVIVELRSAQQKFRRTDFDCYARGAWAVRTGQSIYDVSDDRGWHYSYPPPFAVLMVPLADPAAGFDRAGYLPFSVSVAIWYLFSLGTLAFALDRFASAVLPNETRGSRRWWYARLVPMYVCLGGIGSTLARGQVNILLVALLAASFASFSRFRAGAWLGAAVCLKVIPGLFALVPFIRRDWRGLLGGVAALVFGLVIIPVLVWGPDQALELNRQMVKAVLEPGTIGTGDQTRSKELTNSTATDSQSFQATIHNLLHPSPETRPNEVSSDVRLAHWLLGGALLLAVLWRGWQLRSRSPHSPESLIFFGMIGVVMLHLTPVSHMHYYVVAMPLACGVWLQSLVRNPVGVAPDRATVIVLATYGIMTAAPLFPGALFDILRSQGFGVLASLGLLAFAFHRTRTGKESSVVSQPEQTFPPKLVQNRAA